jgi:penicillin-binding protein 1B
MCFSFGQNRTMEHHSNLQTLDIETPEPPAAPPSGPPKGSWHKYFHSKAAIIAAIVLTAPIVVASIFFISYYLKLARQVDQKLAAGPFSNSANIYASPDTPGSTPPLLANLSPNREKRKMVTFGEIPRDLVNALLSVEDKRFFSHDGFDAMRIMKAAWVDVKDGRKEQGASTLSMQLARGLYLAPDKNWKRKMEELMITMHLEHKLSKKQIFETYANQVYLGRRSTYSIHGFGEGAHAFFGKDISRLTLAEAALLAGMVQRPSYYNPFRNPDRVAERRNVVLTLMKDNRYIDDAQYQEASQTPVKLAEETKDPSDEAPYFLDLVNDEMQSVLQSRENVASIFTTLDLNLQKAAADAVRIGMQEVDKLVRAQRGKRGAAGPDAEVALIAIDPHTGEIRAMAGGRSYSRSQLDHVLAKRPPGSVFKPFVYAAALNSAVEGGSRVFTPASTVDDSPTTFWSGNQSYQPGNFHNAFYGTVTLRRALAKSMNVATVKLGQQVGFNKVVAMAKRAGLNDDIHATPAVALGSYVVTPLEMAGAYTVFANHGVFVKPSLVASIKSQDGNDLYTHVPDTHQALDPRVAYLMVNLLQEVMRSGTAAGVRSRGFTVPAAGKTGTSHDGWFAGFTSQLLCIVWVGFDDYRELNIEGARSALPIWTEFMKRAIKFPRYNKAVDFPAPAGIASAKICSDSGMLATDYCPSTRPDVFIDGTQPSEPCTLHESPEPAIVTLDTETPGNPPPQ